jgi:hypothetical protein
MKNLRVAFCFSGQLRTWKECYISWAKFAAKFETPPDIFCHIWDFNSNSGRVNHITKEQGITSVPPEEFEEFFKIMNPEKYIIEGLEKSKQADGLLNNRIMELVGDKEMNGNIYWAGSQFYSSMHSDFLKQEYEMEHGFEYDLVFKMRYDMLLSDFDIHILFDKPIKYNGVFIPFKGPKFGTVYSIHSGKIPEWPFLTMGDIFYFADSQTFDKVSLFYYRLADIFVKSFKCRHVKPEVYLFFYIKSLMCNHVPISVDPKIVRDETYGEVIKSVNQEPYNCDIIIKKTCTE